MPLRRRAEPVHEKVLEVDASMQGTMVFRDPVNLQINGRFEGRLDTKGKLMIGEHAIINADVRGEYITVAGKVNGNITATKELRLISPAHVTGDINAPLLTVAEGSLMDGVIKMTSGSKSARTYLTTDEVAKFLEVEAPIILEWADNGKLPGMREGNIWKFDKDRIEEWVASEKVK